MIKRSLTTVFLVGLMAMVFVANAQRKSEISSKIKSINGKEYYIHHVKKGETLYGLSCTYKVSVEEIEDLNPKTKEGLKADDIIHIPVRVRKKADPKPVVKEPEHEQVVVKTDSVKELEPVVGQLDSVKEPELVVEATDSSVIIEKITDNVEVVTAIVEPMGKDTIVVTLGGYYVVEEGENLYDIAKKFGIDLADFKAINPELDNNPVAETMIKVPNVVNDKDYIVHKVEYNERSGMSTSTRNAAKQLWPYQLPLEKPEKLAELLFRYENEPGRTIISGAQDAIGICVPGLVRNKSSASTMNPYSPGSKTTSTLSRSGRAPTAPTCSAIPTSRPKKSVR